MRLKIGRIRLVGPMSIIGFVFALLAFLGDQGFKLMMLGLYDMASWPYRRIEVLPFFDVVLAWNKGVSYGLFQQHTDLGQFMLVTVSVITVLGLWLWLANLRRPLPAAGVGLISGGALSNALDRILHGAVADFFWLHWGALSWYVFNLADVAIVVGVVMILYDSFFAKEESGSERV